MRERYVLTLMMLLPLAPAVAAGQETDDRAKTLAQETLDRGATLFDRRDPAAMAATYIETGEIILIKRDSASDRVVSETWRGRAEIEKAYSKVFKDRLPEHRSRNTVESARFLTPDLLMIRGRFAMNRDQGDIAQFVQIRVREEDEWKIVTMQLMELPKENP